MMFHVALRSLCEGSEERLFLEEPHDPFVKFVDLTDTSPAFTQRYLSAFREELPADESKAELQDRLDTGWLVWGKQIEVARLSGWEEETWTIDAESKPGLAIAETAMNDPGWWQTVSASGRPQKSLTVPRSLITGLKRTRGVILPLLISISFWPSLSYLANRCWKLSNPSSRAT